MRQFPAVRLSKYPHFLTRDAGLWDLFIYINPDSLKEIYYDFNIGTGRPYSNNVSPNVKENWQYLTTLRIDAMGLNNLFCFIYEVKFDGDICGIGQLLTYDVLFPESWLKGRTKQKIYIVNSLAPDLLEACARLNIRVVTPETLKQLYPIKYELYK